MLFAGRHNSDRAVRRRCYYGVLFSGLLATWLLSGCQQGASTAELHGGVRLSTVSGPPRKEIIGESVGGNPIYAYRFGQGNIAVLFVGGIHGGYEWNTVALAQQVVAHYSQEDGPAIPEDISLYVIPALNPDGMHKVLREDHGLADDFYGLDRHHIATPLEQQSTYHTVSTQLDRKREGRLNGRGVDLNRNWDCSWAAEATWGPVDVSGGAEAFSEPETKALRSFVRQKGIGAVVFWHSQMGAVFAGRCGEAHSPSNRLARSYANAADYQLPTSVGYDISGGAVDWLAGQGVAAIDVELTNHVDTQLEKNLKGVTAIIGQMTAGTFAEMTAKDVLEPRTHANAVACPFIHQVNDMPDASNGQTPFDGSWACSATSVVMGLVCKGALPRWPESLYRSGSAISPFGAYVSRNYRVGDITIESTGVPDRTGMSHGYGAYGACMGNNTGQWLGYANKMSSYIRAHGFESTFASREDITIDRLRTEFQKGNFVVFSMRSVASTGHISIAFGMTSDRKLVVHDPLGDQTLRNRGGIWPNANGASALYPWHGFLDGRIKWFVTIEGAARSHVDPNAAVPLEAIDNDDSSSSSEDEQSDSDSDPNPSDHRLPPSGTAQPVENPIRTTPDDQSSSSDEDSSDEDSNEDDLPLDPPENAVADEPNAPVDSEHGKIPASPAQRVDPRVQPEADPTASSFQGGCSAAGSPLGFGNSWLLAFLFVALAASRRLLRKSSS